MSNMIRGYKKEEFSAPEMIFRAEISHYAKLTYMYLQMLLDIEGDAMPSHNEVGYYIDASKKSVQRAINELEEVGLIEVVNRKKSPKLNDTNLYIVYHPKQIESLKMLTPYEEIKYMKKKKSMVTQTTPSETYGHTDHTLKPMVTQTIPPEKTSEINGSKKTYGHTDQVTSLVSLDSFSIDESVSDEENIKMAYKKYLKAEISKQQAESFFEAALSSGLSLEEVIDELKYISSEIKIKKNAAGMVYKCLIAGGWYKKKLQESLESKKQQESKPTRKLTRRPSVKPQPKQQDIKLPKAVQLQAKQAQQQQAHEAEPVEQETLEERQARIKAKYKHMTERLTKAKQERLERLGEFRS